MYKLIQIDTDGFVA